MVINTEPVRDRILHLQDRDVIIRMTDSEADAYIKNNPWAELTK